MTTTLQPIQQTRHPFVPMFLVYVLVMTAVILAAHHYPSKMAAYLPGGGVSLLRDGQELSVYHERAGFVYQHMAPYAYQRIEYPLLGTLYLAVPALFANSVAGYSLGLMVLNGLTGMALVYVSYRLLVRLGRPTSLLWLFLLPGIVYFTLNRFDVLPALLVQSSLLLLFNKRWSWSFVVLGLSILAKGYAILLFPVFFVYWLNHFDRARSSLWNNWALRLTAGTVMAGVVLSILMAGFKNGIFPYYFQSTRGFAFGTVYTIYIVGLWNSINTETVKSLMQISAKALFLVQFIVPALVYGGHAYFKRLIQKPENVIHWSIIVVVVYVLFSPYYSPQWLLWLVPLIMVWRPHRLAALFIIAYGLIGYLEYPVAINVFGFDSTHYNMLVLVRTVLLAGILVIVSQQARWHAAQKDQPALPVTLNK